jgi:hypothetical protein
MPKKEIIPVRRQEPCVVDLVVNSLTNSRENPRNALLSRSRNAMGT